MVDRMDEFFEGNMNKKLPKDKSRSEGSLPIGTVEKKVYGNYYDIDNTITTASLTDPNDPDNSSYNVEQIFVSLERNAEVIYVSNDNPIGGAILYVISSHSGRQGFSRERPIYPQQSKEFYNIYEIRLRSPSVGSPYRVTEYNITSNI